MDKLNYSTPVEVSARNFQTRKCPSRKRDNLSFRNIELPQVSRTGLDLAYKVFEVQYLLLLRVGPLSTCWSWKTLCLNECAFTYPSLTLIRRDMRADEKLSAIMLSPSLLSIKIARLELAKIELHPYISVIYASAGGCLFIQGNLVSCVFRQIE